MHNEELIFETEEIYKYHVESIAWVLGEYVGKNWKLILNKDSFGNDIWHIVNLETSNISHTDAYYGFDEAVQSFIEKEPWSK